MSSSMRNAVQRRNHRERGQPEARQKWGLLEKHKDYSLRAKNYNEKKGQLHRLRQKAKSRNPDEFAFGMMSDRSNRQGKHGTREQSRAMSVQTVRKLKKQDEAYTRVMEDRARRKAQKEEKVAPWQGQKIVFVDTPEEQTQTAMSGDS